MLIDLSGESNRHFTLRQTRRDETAEERNIRQYVEAQGYGGDDEVESVALVKRHRLLERSFEVFDVRCVRSRWWVITNMTNLYSQDDFISADYAFSFHLGLMTRLWERDRGEVAPEARSVSERSWRKLDDAGEAWAAARDTEDFQTVGVRLREAMIALVSDYADDDWVSDVTDRPQLANVKGWLEVFAGKLSTKRRQRAYLRGVWDRAWDLVVHLQHDSSAREPDAAIAFNAVEHALELFSHMRLYIERDSPVECPQCGSRRFSETTDWTDDERLEVWQECSACGYATERSEWPLST
ncbi:hypothetical protein [Williamsia herbipolensis]|uniref:hypothetical protein n=1 Tax=Williamsia herbipolensis TaxID=1603258 RepID=UPI000696214A|nr:hypothetical protein [Williamsia herbipolensis]